MADHDNGYKLLFSHAETVADFLRGFVKEDWVRDLDFSSWLTRVLLPSRFPGLRFPEVQDLQEIQNMGLAERVMEWTREWKQEGLQEGLQKGLQKGHEKELANMRDVVLSLLEQRFGAAVSADTRRRVLAIRDLDELNRIAKGVLRARSLRDLGLD